jgi:SSU ribosomal protein S26E
LPRKEKAEKGTKALRVEMSTLHVAMRSKGTRDKAKKVTVRVPLVDAALAKELQAKGAYVPYTVVTKYYCISCAVHFGIVKVRPREERKAEIS